MILECPECQARFKPRFRIKKEHWVGRCSHCGENVEFHIVIKKPVRVLRTKELFLVVCDLVERHL